MKKIAILSGLMLVFANIASAAVTVNTQPTSLVTSALPAAASSSPIGLFSFKLTGDAAETLSSVTVTLNAAGGSTVTGSHLANLSVYKDANNNGVFDSGTDLLAGSQTSVNVGSATTITTSSNNSLTGGATFFVTLSTASGWSNVSPIDSLTATLAANGIITSANSPTVTAVTTSTISAVPVAPMLSTAVAQNNGTKSIVLTFNTATNSPTISSTNINSVLMLSNSHSWLDGNGGLGIAAWSNGGTVLTISLSSAVSSPTIAVGDIVTVSGSVIKDLSGITNATGTATITGSLAAAMTPTLTMAVAANTGNQDGLGAGDTVVLSFSSATNQPSITASNIDSVLALNNSHSWKDGSGAIGSANWSNGGTMLTITLSATTSAPTIAAGDAITIGGSVVKDSTSTNNATGSATISGTTNNNGEGEENDDGEGHSCSNNLMNGHLYKLAGDTNTTVYLAADCVLRPFRGAAVFHARGHKFTNIITLQSLTGLTVSDQPALPSVGTLVKGSGTTIWFVESGHKLKGFTSADVFLGLGFNFGQVNQISDTDLNTMPTDSDVINSALQHPNGALIKCTTSPVVSQVNGTTLVPFANSDSFTLRGHTFQEVATVNCEVFHYVSTTPVSQ
jgi:hypothetical protein